MAFTGTTLPPLPLAPPPHSSLSLSLSFSLPSPPSHPMYCSFCEGIMAQDANICYRNSICFLLQFSLSYLTEQSQDKLLFLSRPCILWYYFLAHDGVHNEISELSLQIPYLSSCKECVLFAHTLSIQNPAQKTITSIQITRSWGSQSASQQPFPEYLFYSSH